MFLRYFGKEIKTKVQKVLALVAIRAAGVLVGTVGNELLPLGEHLDTGILEAFLAELGAGDLGEDLIGAVDEQDLGHLTDALGRVAQFLEHHLGDLGGGVLLIEIYVHGNDMAGNDTDTVRAVVLLIPFSVLGIGRRVFEEPSPPIVDGFLTVRSNRERSKAGFTQLICVLLIRTHD